jgi:hypothetical protein
MMVSSLGNQIQHLIITYRIRRHVTETRVVDMSMKCLHIFPELMKGTLVKLLVLHFSHQMVILMGFILAL